MAEMLFGKHEYLSWITAFFFSIFKWFVIFNLNSNWCFHLFNDTYMYRPIWFREWDVASSALAGGLPKAKQNTCILIYLPLWFRNSCTTRSLHHLLLRSWKPPSYGGRSDVSFSKPKWSMPTENCPLSVLNTRQQGKTYTEAKSDLLPNDPMESLPWNTKKYV